MHIVVAVDSFKGSCSSLEAARAVARGIAKVDPAARVTIIPIADGGEGTCLALSEGLSGVLHHRKVCGPLGDATDAIFAVLPDGTGVVELAAASGLTLLSQDNLDPLRASTYGTGQLIAAALELGCRRLIIGLGGSATNDGGMGLASALGVRFYDQSGCLLPQGGAALANLYRIDLSGLDDRFAAAEIVIACDVNNPLCGPQGASAVFGPQKGASPQQVLQLDAALFHYASLLQTQLGLDLAALPGAGAAGGAALALMAFGNAKIQRGIDVMLDLADFDRLLPSADLVITGEGRIDSQTLFGKVPVGVAARAKQRQVPVIAITGCIADGAEAVYEQGIDAMLSIANGPISLQDSMRQAETLIEAAAERILRLLRIGQSL
ncbi:MAG: glycerate kinase [Negativicutes bacterium]|nr:glycerate kinase [Negativicutes bacterium]